MTIANRFLSGVMLLAGAQTITGDKTFSGDVIVPSTPANDNSAAPKLWVTNQITAAVVVNRPWKETLLDDSQLIDGVTGGIAPAGAFVFTDNPTADETFVLKCTTGTESYTFKVSASGESEVTIGAGLSNTLANLAAKIEAKTGALYHAYVRTNLGSIDSLVLVVVRRAVSDGTDRAYGTAQASYAAFTADKYEAKAADLTALDTTDPGAGIGSFGFRRATADLVPGETHEMRSGDSLGTWDDDGGQWNLRTVTAGVYTAGDGIDVTDNVVSVALASDPGLEFSGGQLRVKANSAGGMELTPSGVGLKSVQGGLVITGGGNLKGNTLRHKMVVQDGATSGDGAATSFAADVANTGGGKPLVFVGKLGPFYVANGNSEKATSECYFSTDAGTTARAWSAIVGTDTLYWNGSVAEGGDLEDGDELTVVMGSTT